LREFDADAKIVSAALKAKAINLASRRLEVKAWLRLKQHHCYVLTYLLIIFLLINIYGSSVEKHAQTKFFTRRPKVLITAPDRTYLNSTGSDVITLDTKPMFRITELVTAGPVELS